MGQIDQFLVSLKRSLKAKNIVYKDLAMSLNLSESSVKRILSDKSISLERIEEICKACDLSFSEICKNADFENESTPFALTEEEEEILVLTPRVLHYFILLNTGLSPIKIEKEYEITNIEAKKILLKLDKMNLIELHPKDRVKIKNKSANLRFRKEGPIGKVLFEHTKKHYLVSDFNGKNEIIRFGSFEYSQSTILKLKKKIEKFFQEAHEESTLESMEDQSLESYGLMIACRPWKDESLDVIKKKRPRS